MVKQTCIIKFHQAFGATGQKFVMKNSVYIA